jgi:predicted regulator of Ras-like GTPase activity (Roadblock/LC7/MglB family)
MDGTEKSLVSILNNFRKDNPSVNGIAISTTDGLPIASDPRDCAELLCATASAVFAAGKGMGLALGMGGLSCAIVEAENSVYLISGSENAALLMSLQSRDEADGISTKLSGLWAELEAFLGSM